jgi:hypothetical protein
MNYMNIALVVLGVALMSGVVKSDTTQPCIANDKLIDIIKDQQTKLSDMLVESKREADVTRKKYEDLLAELDQKGCKK